MSISSNTQYFVADRHAKRKFSDVDAVCKRRRVGLGVNGIGTAVNVVRVPLPPMAWAYIRARPWPKGQAPTLAARRARRRSPRLPGGGIRPVRRLSPGHRATLRTMWYSGTVIGMHPNDQGAIRSDHMLDVITADGKTSSGTSSKYPHEQGANEGIAMQAHSHFRNQPHVRRTG
ncbi:hypothetical protein GGI09_001447 [Coemansia sp. S100]|nr:hypothetical protein GGI09_001447 [Coemansia sp. S100]